jgi:predicted RNase H-like nuclease (RuvC/YqgF family)
MDKNNPKTYRFARNANKFAENLIEKLQAVSIPSDFNYERLHAFCGDVERMLTLMEQQRREAYPYISPYFIFDRRRLDASLNRLADVISELRSSLTTRFAKAKTIEDANSQIDKLLQIINEDRENQESLRQTEEREKTLEAEIAEYQQKIAQVQTKAELKELVELTQRIEGLRENVKHSLSYLEKPFTKLQSLARTGEVAVPLEEMNWLSDYLNDPFTALTKEENGYSSLKNILKRLDAAISRGDLKLKTARIRKAQDQINSVLNKDSLLELQKQCKEALSQKNQLSASGALTESQNQLTQLQSQLKELQRENELTNAKKNSLKSEHEKLKEKKEYQRKELEKNIFQLTNKTVQIVLAS